MTKEILLYDLVVKGCYRTIKLLSVDDLLIVCNAVEIFPLDKIGFTRLSSAETVSK